MSLELYDLALEKKLRNIFDNVTIAPPDDAFARSNEEGKVKLPLISAYRMGNEVNWDEYNHAATFTGKPTRVRYMEGFENDSQGEPRYADVNWRVNPVTTPSMRSGMAGYRMTETIPIKITYQVDIWAQLRRYADDIYRELVFYTTHHPDLLVEIPSVQQPLIFSMQLTDVSTETDYEFGDTNVIHRYTLTYEIPFAQLFFEPDTVPPVLHIPTTYLTYKSALDDSPEVETTMVEASEEYFDLRHFQESLEEGSESGGNEGEGGPEGPPDGDEGESEPPDGPSFPRQYNWNGRPY